MTEFVRWKPFRRNSWHIILLTRSLVPRTLCGRVAGRDFELRSELPAEKTCESCWRVQGARRQRELAE